MFTASVIIPCYNEENTLKTCVDRVLAMADETLAVEIVIVDDCSTDRSREIGQALSDEHANILFFAHTENQGKGGAMSTGIKKATGDVVAVQDADLEYDPQDLRKLIRLIEIDKADAVFGSRFISGGAHRVLYFWHSLGNKFLTFVGNMFTDLNLTDMNTCYKVCRRSLLKDVEFHEKRFGFDPEWVAKVVEQRPRVYEAGITYSGRTYEEGKKIGPKDGIRNLYCLIRYNAYRVALPIQLGLFLPMVLLASVLGLSTFYFFESLMSSSFVWDVFSYFVFAALLFIPASILIWSVRTRLSPQSELWGFSMLVTMGLVANEIAILSLEMGTLPDCLVRLFSFWIASVLIFFGFRALRPYSSGGSSQIRA